MKKKYKNIIGILFYVLAGIFMLGAVVTTFIPTNDMLTFFYIKVVAMFGFGVAILFFAMGTLLID